MDRTRSKLDRFKVKKRDLLLENNIEHNLSPQLIENIVFVFFNS